MCALDMNIKAGLVARGCKEPEKYGVDKESF